MEIEIAFISTDEEILEEKPTQVITTKDSSITSDGNRGRDKTSRKSSTEEFDKQTIQSYSQDEQAKRIQTKCDDEIKNTEDQNREQINQVIDDILSQVISYKNNVDNLIDDILVQDLSSKTSIKENTKIKVSKQDFTFEKEVGRGTQGTVQKGCQKDGTVVAIKQLKKRELPPRMLRRTELEKMILAKSCQPFIMTLKQAFQTSNHLQLVTDQCSGGELFHAIQKRMGVSMDMTRFQSAQIVLALEQLHSHGILQRDLKPENILLCEDGYLKVTDFGLAKQYDDQSLDPSSFVGTFEYIAPEVIQRKPVSFQVDQWSLGCVIYNMVTGYPPFMNVDKRLLMENILTQPIKWPTNKFPRGIPTDLKNIVESLLLKDPDKRLGAEGIHQIKAHAQFKGIDFGKVYHKKYNGLKVYDPNTNAKDGNSTTTQVLSNVSPTENEVINTAYAVNNIENWSYDYEDF